MQTTIDAQMHLNQYVGTTMAQSSHGTLIHVESFMNFVQRWRNVDTTLYFQRQRSTNGPHNISTLGQCYHAIWDMPL